jgi:hypothetical protein
MKTEAKLRKHFEYILSGLNFPNVSLEECTVDLYDGCEEYEAEIFLLINPDQNTVEKGLPKKVMIYSDLKEITISYLASNDLDENGNEDIKTIEVVPYGISVLKRKIIDYQSQTY